MLRRYRKLKSSTTMLRISDSLYRLLLSLPSERINMTRAEFGLS